MAAFPKPPIEAAPLGPEGQITEPWARWFLLVSLFITQKGGIGGPLSVAAGGTGFASYAVGDMLYAATVTTFGKLVDVAAGNVVLSGGVGGIPAYGKVGLTTHVSGVLAEANGGTAQSTYAVGDLLYASGVNTLAKRAIGANTNVMTVVGGVPAWAAPATSGTVTSVSVTTAVGVSGSVATATSTPAITITLGAIAPTSVAASGSLTGTVIVPTSSAQPALGMYTAGANTLSWSTNSAERLHLTTTALEPNTDNGLTLGRTAKRYSTVFAGALADGADQLVGSSGTTARVAAGSGWTGVSLFAGGATQVDVTAASTIVRNGQLVVDAAGKGLSVKEGSNAKMGTATLSGGTVTVSTTAVTASSRLFLTAPYGTLTNLGEVKESARTAGTSFVLTSLNILDAASYGWMLVEPA